MAQDNKPHPRFGPKQTRALKQRDVGIGGGPPKGGGRGPNRANDTGMQGIEAATMGRGARDGADSNTKREGTEKQHRQVVEQESLPGNDSGNVKGQNPKGRESPGLGGVGNYEPDGNRHGGHDGSMRHLGKHGRHDSVKGYEHDGYEHSSEDR